MATQSEIEAFLSQFKVKMKVFSVIFLNREKNLSTLLELEITPASRRDVLDALGVEDYYRGPTPDIDRGREDYWEFGRPLDGREIYIKIRMGYPGHSGNLYIFSLCGACDNLSVQNLIFMKSPFTGGTTSLQYDRRELEFRKRCIHDSPLLL